MTVAKKKATEPASAPVKSAGAPSLVSAPKVETAAAKKKKVVIDEVSAELLKADPSVMLLGASSMSIKIRGVIPSGAPSLDAAIGRGGIPLGRLTILHGGEGSGKTTAALHFVANAQARGGRAYYIDKEHKLDLDYAGALGVDVDAMYYSTPSHLEGAFEVMAKAIEIFKKYDDPKSSIPHIIVLDSMNAAITKAQFEGAWDDKHMAPQARVYSELLPKLIPLVSKTNVALLWISQVRKKMNVQYGDDSEVAGGNSAKFYASLIMDVKRIGYAKEGEERVGNRTKFYMKKNQIARPFKEAEIEITNGNGFNKERSLIDLAEDMGLITKSGSWLVYDEEKIGQGYPNTCEFLTSEKGAETAKHLRAAVAKSLKW